jgi:cytidine deaminase
MKNKTETRLLKSALAARKHAHAPYSKYRVGAALLSSDGKIFTGCNVENASYGLTVCAERVAVANAVNAGKKTFAAIAIAADGKGNPVAPCGACRQVLAEFAPNLRVILVNARNPKHVEQMSLSELLPRRFRRG